MTRAYARNDRLCEPGLRVCFEIERDVKSAGDKGPCPQHAMLEGSLLPFLRSLLLRH